MKLIEEQEAHDELFEFERCFKAGQREEALQRFPTLLTRMGARSTLIGLAFLRFTDLFIQSSNDWRRRLLLLLRQPTCQNNIPYAEGQADEIVRRLGNLWESNDEMARVGVIRFYGLMSVVTAGRTEVIYRIRISLTSLSQSEEEVDIALWAATKLAMVDAPRVIPPLIDVLLYIWQNSHPASHRRTLLYSILPLPTFDLHSDAFILTVMREAHPPHDTQLQSLINQIKRRSSLLYNKNNILLYSLNVMYPPSCYSPLGSGYRCYCY